jgi:hypothetical protein
MNRPWAAALLLTILALPAQAAAQVGSGRPAAIPADSAARRAATGFSSLGMAKWSTLAAATAAGIFGFIESARADDRYSEHESLCEENRADCLLRTADGAYVDPSFESIFQSVRRHDRRAHYALIAGQVGLASSVVLFLLDLGNARPPRDIPWVPQELNVQRRPGAVSVGFRLPLARRD